MDYEAYQIFKEKEFEEICQRCGNCCGLKENDPCIHLVSLPEGRYHCDIYESREGMHKTRNGRFFQCVSIRKILHQDWPGNWDCAYKKLLKTTI